MVACPEGVCKGIFKNKPYFIFFKFSNGLSLDWDTKSMKVHHLENSDSVLSCSYFTFPSNLGLLATKINEIHNQWKEWVRCKGYCQVSEQNQEQMLGSNQVHCPRLSGSSNGWQVKVWEALLQELVIGRCHAKATYNTSKAQALQGHVNWVSGSLLYHLRAVRP